MRRRKIKIEGINSNLQIGSEENLKIQNGSDIGIDFGKCPEKIRFNFGIQNNDNDILYKVFEVTINNTKIIRYKAYETDNLENPIELSLCEGETVKIINSPELNENFENAEEFLKIINILKEGIEIYNAYSPIYTDYCYPLSVLDKYDLILRDRREYIDKKNIPLCEKDCLYEGENVKLLKVICYCPIKANIDEKPSVNLFAKDNKNYFSNHNFNVLKCYKLTFSYEGQKNNIFSEIFIFLFILNISLIIITEMNLKKNLDNLISYCIEYIDKNNSNNNEFQKLIRKDPDIMKPFKRTIEERFLHLNNPPKRHRIKNNTNTLVNINNNSENNIKNNEKNKNKELDLNKQLNSINSYYHNYYIYLIYSYIKNERKEFLIKEELNNLEYEYYINIENRKCYIILLSLFKINYDFINTFLIYNSSQNYKDYKLYSIKMMIYINSLIFSIIVNLISYSDETMHKLYEDNGKYNILYRLPIIFMTDMITKGISLIFEKIIIIQDDFIKLKINTNKYESKKEESKEYEPKEIINDINELKEEYLETNEELNKKEFNKKSLNLNYKKRSIENIRNNNSKIKEEIYKDEQAIKIKKIFRYRSIIFYIISIILNIFGWYNISCFCSIYEKTQKHLIKDFLYGIPKNIIMCFLFTFIYCSIKQLAIIGNGNKIKKCIYFIFHNDYFRFIFEELIELSIFLLIKYKKILYI